MVHGTHNINIHLLVDKQDFTVH